MKNSAFGDREQSQDSEMDNQSSNSDFQRWVYQNRFSQDTTSNENVLVVSDPYRFKRLRTDKLVIVPKLDFKKLDPYRQYPEENSKNDDIKKKLDKVLNEGIDISPRQIKKKLKEIPSETQQKLPKPQRNNQMAGPGAQMVITGTYNSISKSKHNSSAATLLNRSDLPSQHTKKDTENTEDEIVTTRISGNHHPAVYFLVLVLIVLGILDFLPIVHGFPWLRDLMDGLSSKVIEQDAGKLIFSYLGLSIFLKYLCCLVD